MEMTWTTADRTRRASIGVAKENGPAPLSFPDAPLSFPSGKDFRVGLETDRILHQQVRNGVPVYWTEGCPRLIGALMFRVGRSDESVVTGGITHLVEHLVLHGIGGRQSYPFNGLVDGIRTVFHATGRPEEIASFMSRVCEGIARLPLERIGDESRVLRTEAASRPSGVTEASLWYRFGSIGHGQVNFPEYGLESPDRAAVASWATECFTADNAVAWFSGPVPADVSFAALPRGRLLPCVEPTPVAHLQAPAFLNWKSGGVCISFVTNREAWIQVPWTIAGVRLEEQLRFRQGVTYAVHVVGHVLKRDQLHSSILIQCLDEHAATVLEGLLGVLDNLARKGPSKEELQQSGEGFARQMDDPESAPRVLDPACVNHLLDYPTESTCTLLERMQSRSSEEWAESVRTAMQTALLLIPPGCPPPPAPFRRYPPWSEKKVKGTCFHTVGWNLPWSRKKGLQLIVGKEGVSLVFPGGGVLTVVYDACEGIVIRKDQVDLIGRDAVHLDVRAKYFRRGEDVCDAIVRSLPLRLIQAGLVIRTE